MSHSSQLCEGHANKIKHEHSPVVQVQVHLFQETFAHMHDVVQSASNKQRLINITTTLYYIPYIREKGRDLPQSYDKCPYTHRKIKQATKDHKNELQILISNPTLIGLKLTIDKIILRAVR